MEEQLPTLAESLFGQATGLSEMDVKFSLNEPALNVYGAGATTLPGAAISLAVVIAVTVATDLASSGCYQDYSGLWLAV